MTDLGIRRDPRQHGHGETHDWREAGDAWGRRVQDWACLFEHYSFEAMTAMFERVGVAPGARVLDVACGAGLAVRHALSRGADARGIDASQQLVQRARDRNPGTEIVVGSMFDLPWPDESFDAVVSINGIWGGCRAALVEAHRVLRPDGLLAFSFWGQGPPLDLRPVFKVFARHVPQRNVEGMRSLNDISVPGVAERMVLDAGLVPVERGSRTSVMEFADDELAWRAMASTGPAAPAVAAADPAVLRREVLDALAPCRDGAGGYRFTNDHQFVVARRPGL